MVVVVVVVEEEEEEEQDEAEGCGEGGVLKKRVGALPPQSIPCSWTGGDGHRKK